MKYRKEKSEHKSLALKNIELLFDQASKSSFPDKYVKYGRKLAMKFQLSLPSSLKRQFCKNCYIYFKQGENVTIRIHKAKIIYTCTNCKCYWRMPLK